MAQPPAKLRRVVGPVGGLFLTLALLSPGLGVFVVGNDMLHQAGSGTVICLVAAAILGVAVAAVYAELGSAFPNAGAEYTLTTQLLGTHAGFAMMALFMVVLPIGLAVSALGIADYLHPILPGLSDRQVAIPTMCAAVAIAACSIRMNAAVTGLLVAAECAALLATFALGLIHAQPDGLHRLLHPTMALAAGGIGPVPLSLLAVAGASGIYALNGYGGAVCFGEELENPHHVVGRLVYQALFVGAGIIILPLAALLAGAADLNGLYRAPAPILGFVHETGGATLATLVSLSVAAAVFNCMIALGLNFGRLAYAFARDEGWPGPVNRLFGQLSPRFGSPAAATLVMGALAVPLCFAPTKILILINGNANIAVYGAVAVAVLAGRRSGATAHSRSAAWLHPLAPVFVLVAMAALTVADLMDAESGRPALLATVIVTAAGVGYAEFVDRKKKGRTFFFEKKNQKTFVPLSRRHRIDPR
jgi:amino acid transporter